MGHSVNVVVSGSVGVDNAEGGCVDDCVDDGVDVGEDDAVDDDVKDDKGFRSAVKKYVSEYKELTPPLVSPTLLLTAVSSSTPVSKCRYRCPTLTRRAA